MGKDDIFARNLLVIRKEFDLTQELAAELCGISSRHWNNLELQKSIPRLDVLRKISKGLNVGISDLTEHVWQAGCSQTLYPQGCEGESSAANTQEEMDTLIILGSEEVNLKYRYVPFAQFVELLEPDHGPYLTYGIRVEEKIDNRWDLIRAVHDISCDRQKVVSIAAQLSSYRFVPEHLNDIIEDFL